MPQYYFDVDDEGAFADDLGIDLTDLSEAKTEALRLVGELLREQPGRIGEDGCLRIAIRSHDNALLAQVELRAEWLPAARRVASGCG